MINATTRGMVTKVLTPQTAHVQQLLNPPTEKEIAGMRETLSRLIRDYINLEDQKKAADADYNERMADLWDDIRALRARITEAEEAAS